MTDPVLIFREEALRSRDAQPPPARTPRTQRPEPPRWLTAACWALMALMAAGLAAGLLIRAGNVARGPAVIRDGAVQAVVPAAFVSDLHPGLRLELTRPGRAPVTVVLTATGPEVADARAATTLLRTKVSGAGPLLLIRAVVPQRAAPAAPTPTTATATGTGTGTVSVQVGSRPLIVALVEGLVSGAGDG